MFLITANKLMRLMVSASSTSSLMLITVFNVNAAGSSTDVTLTCKETATRNLLDLKALGINLSSSVPVGTVVASGTVTAKFKCAMNDFIQYKDKMIGEVYFKRQPIPEEALGYGLTLYTGYGGDMSNEEANIPTGIMISTYAITSGGTVGEYTEATLSVPYQLVKTSDSMSPAIALRNNVVPFSVGSLVVGAGTGGTSGDLPFNFSNNKTGFVTVIDETCKVAGEANQVVSLGSYTTHSGSGLGAGIGQTTAARAFNIQLNCEALLSGNFDVMMQFDGDASSGLDDVGVVALNATSTAGGVGVQILDENQKPVALAKPFHIASYPLSSALLTVPFYARYYQTAARVKPGSANAVVKYTISYQ